MPSPTRILVPVDFEEGGQHVLETAVQWARPFQGSLVVLHVWEPPRLLAGDTLYAMPGFDTRSLTEIALHEARRHMDALVAAHVAEDIPLTTRLESGPTATTVMRVAGEMHAELIVLGTHGRRGLARALLGSVAHAVIARARVPVLTVPISTG